MRLQVEFRVTPDVVKLVSRLHFSPEISTKPTKLYTLGFTVLSNMWPFCNCNIHLIAQEFMVIIDGSEPFCKV